MHLRDDRYIGVAPMPGGLTNACVVTADRAAVRDPGGLLRETLRQDASLAPRFSAASAASRPVCLGPLAVDSRRCGMPGLLLVGDAAGFIDPMTGDGLRFACRGAELTAEAAIAALSQGDPDPSASLAARRRAEFGGKWRFNRALRTMTASPAALRLAAAGADWMPSMLERIVQYAGDVGAAGPSAAEPLARRS
jgi:flavin-dependent dehydrogenase